MYVCVYQQYVRCVCCCDQMNVLHLHLSDWAGVRFQVPMYPELTAGLNGQFYTNSDAAQLVTYAKQRGVRIVPEVGHGQVDGCPGLVCQAGAVVTVLC